MKRAFIFGLSISLVLLCGLLPRPVQADASHARIVRLSLVQGQVRFARDFHKDSMDDSKAVWELAPLNLPIRQGYAISTDSDARAEVEFENGAMAFLSPNTTVEFYDLSLDEGGAFVTRLILRQGSGIFYVHPAKGDYFSVTGGDFSVEANGRTRFRLDNFDDGSSVAVEQGQINVLRNKGTQPLTKGQAYSINVGKDATPVIARAGDPDDFDKWVSGRIDSVATATAYSSQYVNSGGYDSGFADLYNYGSFYNVPGYGWGWQPYGVGLGWSPFAFGNWYYDASFGWDFIGSAPWGWLPYHYGGWAFAPGLGWMWMPMGFEFGGMGYPGAYGYGGYGYAGYGYGGYGAAGYGGYPYPYRHGPIYHPITAVWVRNGNTTGLVPMNPMDKNGKTPINLVHGVYPLNGNGIAATPVAPVVGEKWSVEKNPPKGLLFGTTFARTTQPTRVSRTILSSNTGSRPVTLSRDSSIVYDGQQHRFVNSNAAPAKVVENAKMPSGIPTRTAAVAERNAKVPNAATAERSAAVVNRPHINPPTPPMSAGRSAESRGAESRGGGMWGGAAESAPSMSSSHTMGSSPAGHSGGGGGGGGAGGGGGHH
jgi:FecR protein